MTEARDKAYIALLHERWEQDLAQSAIRGTLAEQRNEGILTLGNMQFEQQYTG